MLQFPASTQFGRRIPKQKFYEHLDVLPEVRQLFVEQIKTITWTNKLSPQTMNIAPGEKVQEIEVFRIHLTGSDLDIRVLNLVDRQIPYHLLFILERLDGTCQISVTYKKKGQVDDAFQLWQTYRTPWTAADALSLDLSALDMDALYESIVRQVAGDALSAAPAGPVGEAIAQAQQRERLENQIDALKGRMRWEKQLARQMELRQEMKQLEKEFLENES